MRQRRARKTTVRLYPPDDPRRHGPGRGSINFLRWFAKRSDDERKSIVRASNCFAITGSKGIHNFMRDDTDRIYMLDAANVVRDNAITAESIERIDQERYRIVLTETHPPLFIKRAELRDNQ